MARRREPDDEMEDDSSPEEGVAVERIGGRKGGTNVTIKADARTGWFTANVAGDHYSAKTKDELLTKLAGAIKKTRVRISVPLTIIGTVARVVKAGVGSYRSWTTYDPGVGYQHAVLVGTHASTGALLLRKEDGSKFERDRWGGRDGTLCRRLTPEEVEQYIKLHTEYERARKAYEKFEARVEIKDPEKFVNKKLAEAADAVKEEPEVDDDPR
jgi:hypothetical protein